MDLKAAENGQDVILSITNSDISDIGKMVDEFVFWDQIASADNPEPMEFMSKFGRDCRWHTIGDQTLHYEFKNGSVVLLPNEARHLASFIKSYVENMDGVSFMRRMWLNMAWKTLDSRLATMG